MWADGIFPCDAVVDSVYPHDSRERRLGAGRFAWMRMLSGRVQGRLSFLIHYCVTNCLIRKLCFHYVLILLSSVCISAATGNLCLIACISRFKISLFLHLVYKKTGMFRREK